MTYLKFHMSSSLSVTVTFTYRQISSVAAKSLHICAQPPPFFPVSPHPAPSAFFPFHRDASFLLYWQEQSEITNWPFRDTCDWPLQGTAILDTFYICIPALEDYILMAIVRLSFCVLPANHLLLTPESYSYLLRPHQNAWTCRDILSRPRSGNCTFPQKSTPLPLWSGIRPVIQLNSTLFV